MCYQKISVAICAPEQPNELSYTCSKLHMVASDHHVCKDVKGGCLCFIGTCGTLNHVLTTAAIDFSAIKKVRCVSCTKLEDGLADRRSGQQIIDSVLLTKSGVSEDQFPEYAKFIHSLWGEGVTCPWHDDQASTVGTNTPALATPTESDSEGPGPVHLNAAAKEFAMKTDVGQEAPVVPKDPVKIEVQQKAPAVPKDPVKNLAVKSGLSASRWAPENNPPEMPEAPRPNKAGQGKHGDSPQVIRPKPRRPNRNNGAKPGK